MKDASCIRFQKNRMISETNYRCTLRWDVAPPGEGSVSTLGQNLLQFVRIGRPRRCTRDPSVMPYCAGRRLLDLRRGHGCGSSLSYGWVLSRCSIVRDVATADPTTRKRPDAETSTLIHCCRPGPSRTRRPSSNIRYQMDPHRRGSEQVDRAQRFSHCREPVARKPKSPACRRDRAGSPFRMSVESNKLLQVDVARSTPPYALALETTARCSRATGSPPNSVKGRSPYSQHGARRHGLGVSNNMHECHWRPAKGIRRGLVHAGWSSQVRAVPGVAATDCPQPAPT
jgi:hypothetical protein